jgi:integrase
MKPWGQQKGLKDTKVPNINEVTLMAEGIDKPVVRALFVLSYLTAGRICELVRYNRKGIRKDSIKRYDFVMTEKQGRKVILITLRNEKNRKRGTKDIPIPLDRDDNVNLFNLVKPYLDSIPMDSELFPFGYQNAYKQLKKYVDWNPHWFRHIRATHLITMYGLNEQLLIRFMGWTDSRPAKHYSELRWEDLLDKL